MKQQTMRRHVLPKTSDKPGPRLRSRARKPPSSLKRPISPSCHWRLRVIHDYWRSKLRENDDLPAPQDINIGELPDIAPYVWTIEVVRNPMRFRFHSVGAAIVRWAGEDNTGKWFDDIWPTYDPAVFIDVAERREPSWGRGPSGFRPERLDCEIERIRLPLASNGRTVDRILALSVFFDKYDRELLTERELKVDSAAYPVPSKDFGTLKRRFDVAERRCTLQSSCTPFCTLRFPYIALLRHLSPYNFSVWRRQKLCET